MGQEQEVDEGKLSAALKFARTRKDMSAASLSRKCGYSPSYVTKIENGSVKPSLEAFSIMAEELELTDQEVLWFVQQARIESER